METKTLEAQRRSSMGTKHTRKLRRTDHVPGIIYGDGEGTVPFSVPRHDLEVELLHGQRVLSLNLDGKTQSYLIKDIQYDHLGKEFLHIDLAAVDLNETVTLKVSIELRGTPKGAAEGGVLDQVLNELEVQCLASSIPSKIRANVAKLDVNDSLCVGDLELPEGVETTHQPGDIVATIRVVAEEAEPAATEEEEPAAPEVISKGKVEEEEEKTEKQKS